MQMSWPDIFFHTCSNNAIYNPPMSTAQYLLRINIQSRFYKMNCITSFLKTIYEIKSQKKRKCKQNRYSTIK